MRFMQLHILAILSFGLSFFYLFPFHGEVFFCAIVSEVVAWSLIIAGDFGKK
jgi:hypothetical protein